MASQSKRVSHKPSQRYDSTLKELVQKQPQEILNVLLPGAIYEETLNVESIKPTIRADKVFKVMYNKQECILHLEFQSGYDKDMPSRLLKYNVSLYGEHDLTVITIVIYLFKAKLPESPFVVKAGDEKVITFHFKLLPLFEQDAEKYVRDHVACMYPLLPTMRNVNRGLIKQAVDELVILYKQDEITLGQQIIWMELLLERTATIPNVEKRQIKEELHMFDKLVDESPWLQEMRARSMAKGLQEGRRKGHQEGRQEGSLENARQMIMDTVEIRFPNIAGKTQLRIDQITDLKILREMNRQLILAPDESTVLRIIDPSVA